MIPNPLLSMFHRAPGHYFGLEVCGACQEPLCECRSVFYRNNHCSYNAAYCSVTMRNTATLICLAIGAPPRPFAALRT